MKTVKMEVPVEIAKRMLSEFESQISDKMRQRDALNADISQLEQSTNTLRSQLKNGSGDMARPRGENTAKIREYLSKIPDNKGARMSQISKATGIGASSTAFTLKNYTKDFVLDGDKKTWKLKT